MNYVKVTKWVIIITTAALIVYDVIAYVWGDDATLSQQFWAWSKDYPVVPFLGGFLCGHLFFPQYLEKK